MGLLDTFRSFNDACPFEQVGETINPQQPAEWDKPADDPQVWLDRYAQFKSRPQFNPNVNGYISPYASAHWGSSSDIMQTLSDGFQYGPLQEKVDPNKIFNSDIAALRTLAADQIKVVKVFERKMLESLNDRGKFGVNEDDIAAMQALTSARAAITAINKEQVAIKKNIAELKIKQQQVSGTSTAGNNPNQVSGSMTSNYDVGRSIMDQIFDMPIPAAATAEPTVQNYPTMDLEEASNVLENLVNVSDVPSSIHYESDNPTTYVIVGDSDSDVEFATYSSSGELLSDYPNPTSKIQSIDRESGKAVDELLIQYPIKLRENL